MKKIIIYTFLGFLFFATSSFVLHKFYVAVYQVNFAPEKKMLQITSRIFVDDLNKALEKKYSKKAFFGTEKESPEDLILVKKYFSENLLFKVNGQSKAIQFLSKELEGDVLICYCSIKEVAKINTLEIQNSILVDWNSEQQNIMHFTIMGIKKSLLFTDSNRGEMLKY